MTTRGPKPLDSIILMALIVILLVPAPCGGQPVLADDATGSISGTVYAQDAATPLVGVRVYALISGELDQPFAGQAQSGADGRYTISGLATSTYVVQAMGNASHVWAYYDGTRDPASATDVAVASPQTTTGIDFTLDQAASISGHVFEDDGSTPLEGVAIAAGDYASDDRAWDGLSTSAADGSYTISGLAPGDYRVRAAGTNAYALEYYDDATTPAGAAPIAASAGQNTTGVDFVLAQTGLIEGRIIGGGAAPLANVGVYAFDADNSGAWIGHALSAADGSYSIAGLPAGDYILQAMGNSLNVWEYYDGTRSASSATRVTVNAGAATSSIDLSLDAAGQIAGTIYGHDGVTPLAATYVYAYSFDDASGAWQGYGVTQANGTYLIQGLAPGDYRVQAMGGANHVWKYHQDTQIPSIAQRVTVSGGVTTSGIDMTLGQSGSVAGAIYAADGVTPLAGVSIEIAHHGSGEVVVTLPSSTDSSGYYDVGPLAPGDYVVYACGTADYVGEYYQDAYLADDADVVTVLAGQQTLLDNMLLAVNAPCTVPVDVDGDARFDLFVWRPDGGNWYGLLSSQDYGRTYAERFTKQWGGTGDVPLVGDLDGDSMADIFVWKPDTGTWYGALSTRDFSTSFADRFTVQWGSPGDIPLVGDMDGDGRVDLFVWRPDNGYWYGLLSTNDYDRTSGQYWVAQWGLIGDVPSLGDLDGDGRTDVLVWRESSGYWYGLVSSRGYSRTSENIFRVQWGAPGDEPQLGDIEGDGRGDILVWRPANGTWYGLLSSRNYGRSYAERMVTQWGLASDEPLLGDLDGDSRDDLFAWRPSTGYWYGLLSSRDYARSYAERFATQWGMAGDVPLD